jgi:hypothetical protein
MVSCQCGALRRRRRRNVHDVRRCVYSDLTPTSYEQQQQQHLDGIGYLRILTNETGSIETTTD